MVESGGLGGADFGDLYEAAPSAMTAAPTNPGGKALVPRSDDLLRAVMNAAGQRA